MTCPKCGGEVTVVDSRSDVETVVRRRRCKECRYVFYTQEIIADSVAFGEIANMYFRERRKKHDG